MKKFSFVVISICVAVCFCNEDGNEAVERLKKKNLLQGAADVVFLLDRSGSVGKANFEIMKGFVESLLMQVVVDANATRVAVITYSTTVKLHINFIKNPKSKCFFALEMQDIVYDDVGATDIAAALEKASVVLADARPNVNKVVILIGDGMATAGDDPIPVATRLKAEIAVEIFTFGIGKFLSTQLKKMASSEKHFYACPGFQEFKKLATIIRGDPHESKWSNQASATPSCDHLCVSPYRGDPNDPGCCDHHGICSCALLSGTHTCVCLPGYFGLSGTWGKCRACPVGTYRSKLEPSSSCESCPLHSTTLTTASTSIKDCYCKEGHLGDPSKGIPCKSLTCPPLQNPSNGFIVGKCNNSYSTTCYFMCADDYELVDGNTGERTCQSDGHWSSNQPVCRRIRCSQPLRPVYGGVRCQEKEHFAGSVCEFSCSLGFILRGSHMRQCLPSSRWSGFEATCVPYPCPIPKPLRHGKVMNCDSYNKPTYNQNCIFRCNDGYKLVGPQVVTCNENGDLVDSMTQGKYSDNIPYCRDTVPPWIRCPKSKRLETIRGKPFTLVQYETPDAGDNSGIAPLIESDPPNIQWPAKLSIGKTLILYTAIDGAGLSANCSYVILVEDREPPLVISCPATLTFNTSDVKAEVFWEEPQFHDNSQKVAGIKSTARPGDVFTIGTHSIAYFAEDPYGNRANCTFDVIVTQTECPYYPSPINGALVCEDWMYGQFCQTHCESNYDFVVKPAEWYVCTSEATWTTIPEGHSVPWPDCTTTRHPNGIRQMLQGYYYRGNCSEPRVQHAIKKAFLHHFTKQFPQQEYCRTKKACLVEKVVVKCGATTPAVPRTKRSVWNRAGEQELEIEFDIFIDPSLGSNKLNTFFGDFLASVGNLDWNVDDELENELGTVSSPFHEIDAFLDNVDVPSLLRVTSKETQILCPPGAVLKDQECMLCPPGSFHSSSAGQCVSCAIGHYQELEGQAECMPCPANSSTAATNCRNETDCKDLCMEGTYSPTGLETCIACPISTYQDQKGQTSCMPCPYGTTTTTEASSGVQDCQKLCPPGSYSEPDGHVCKPCAVGFYQAEFGQTQCEECPANLTTTGFSSVSPADCIEYDHCRNSSECEHYGVCVSTKYGFVCQCATGYTGLYCESDVNECTGEPCSNGGVCINSDGSYFCNCSRGFEGDLCDLEVDECEGDPCMNNGTCIDQYDGYLCICGAGYSGSRCDEILELCVNDVLCLNGGICDQSIGTCACLTGFSGPDCSVDEDDCFNVTCQNGGSCLDGIAEYRCDCVTGFTGFFCETDIDECVYHQCFGGSACLDGVGGYRCLCPPEWTGERCEEKLSSDFVLSYPENLSLANMASASLDKPLSEATVSMWVQTTSVNGRCGTPLSYATYASSQVHVEGGGVIDNALTISDCSDVTVYVNNEPLNLGIDVADGAWHHLALTWTSNNSGEWRFYKDGQEVSRGQGLQRNASIPAGGQIIIGQEQDNIGGGFSSVESYSGNITRLNIWSKAFDSGNVADLSHMNDDIPGKVVAWSSFRQTVTGDVQLLENEKPIINGNV